MTTDLPPAAETVRRRSMGSHQSASMMSDTWLTPPSLIEKLGAFDLDPCCPPSMPWSTATQSFTIENDGLSQRWHGRVWLNPPYSREAIKWLARMADHNWGTALIFARTETAWFRDYIWKRAAGLLFLDGRIHFHHLDGTRARANAGAPSVLVAYGRDDERRLAKSGIAGTFINSWAA